MATQEGETALSQISLTNAKALTSDALVMDRTRLDNEINSEGSLDSIEYFSNSDDDEMSGITNDLQAEFKSGSEQSWQPGLDCPSDTRFVAERKQRYLPSSVPPQHRYEIKYQ
jgi:hypothetical protein